MNSFLSSAITATIEGMSAEEAQSYLVSSLHFAANAFTECGDARSGDAIFDAADVFAAQPFNEESLSLLTSAVQARNWAKVGAEMGYLVKEASQVGCTSLSCKIAAQIAEFTGVRRGVMLSCIDDNDRLAQALEEARLAISEKSEDASVAFSSYVRELGSFLSTCDAENFGLVTGVFDRVSIAMSEINAADMTSDAVAQEFAAAVANEDAHAAALATVRLIDGKKKDCDADECQAIYSIRNVLGSKSRSIIQTIQDIIRIGHCIYDAVKAFKDKDYDSVFAYLDQALEILKNFFNDDPDTLAQIALSRSQIKASKKQRRMPDKLIISGVDILPGLKAAANAFQKKKYIQFGYQLGTIIKNIVSSSCTSSSCRFASTLAEELEGDHYSVRAASSSFEMAFDAISTAIDLMAESVSAFEAAEQLESAFAYLSDGYSLIGADYSAIVLDTANAYIKSVETDDNAHLLLGGVDLMTYLNFAKELRDQDFIEDAAAQFAFMFKDLDILPEMEMNGINIRDIFTGFLKAYNIIKSIYKCAKSVSAAYNDAKVAMNYFRNK